MIIVNWLSHLAQVELRHYHHAPFSWSRLFVLSSSRPPSWRPALWRTLFNLHIYFQEKQQLKKQQLQTSEARKSFTTSSSINFTPPSFLCCGGGVYSPLVVEDKHANYFILYPSINYPSIHSTATKKRTQTNLNSLNTARVDAVTCDTFCLVHKHRRERNTTVYWKNVKFNLQ